MSKLTKRIFILIFLIMSIGGIGGVMVAGYTFVIENHAPSAPPHTSQLMLMPPVMVSWTGVFLISQCFIL